MTILDGCRLKDGDLVENAAPRLPVCICIDTSFSMMKDNRMHQVNDGVRTFIKQIEENDYAVDSVELCLISFGGCHACVVNEFQNVKKIRYEDLYPSGNTPLGQAAELAYNKIKERQEKYEIHGITAYKPWLILISDGCATDPYQEAARKIRYFQKRNEIKVLCIGIGDEENDLQAFREDGKVVQIERLQLDNFFLWLSKSMTRQSMETAMVDLEMNEEELDRMNM